MEALLTTPQVLKLINNCICRSQLLRMVRRNEFPGIIIKGAERNSYKFKRAHVLAWLNNNGNKAFREYEGMLEK